MAESEHPTTTSSLEGENNAGGRFQFPAKIDAEYGQWMMFTRYKYERPNSEEVAKNQKVGNVVVLPVPEQLQTSYGAQWDNTELGMFGKDLAKMAGDVIKNVRNGQSYTDAMINGLHGNKIVDAIKKLSIDQFMEAGGEVISNLGDAAGDLGMDVVSGSPWWKQGSSYHGLARNPFHAVLYTGPEFRSFRFAWKLIPENQEEADTIRSLIREFKLGMTPEFDKTFGNNLFDYPDTYQIQFGKPDYLFKMAQCALKDVAVNYHGEGKPKYFKGKIPFSITLELTFQELEILTRKDFEGANF
jgi:hypothetical protein